MSTATKVIKREEGYSETAYFCSEGYPTIGVGWRLGSNNEKTLEPYKYMSVSLQVAELKCSERIFEIREELASKIPFFFLQTTPRQAMLISMAYQMGVDGLMKFKNMLKAIEDRAYSEAYIEGLDSLWAKQTPERAERQMLTMKHGTWKEYE